MTSGSAALAPPYLFEAGAFDDLLTGLKDKFDYILFDAAPLGLHFDSVFLASRVDGVILVIKAETTQVDTGLAIKKRLEDAGAHFLGVVVNQAQNYIPKALRRLLS
jgi:MinD-like ATPase involved in chromosome partitioning or flagellar assembly